MEMDSMIAKYSAAVFDTPGCPELEIEGVKYKLMLMHHGAPRYAVIYRKPDGTYYECLSEIDKFKGGLVHYVGREWMTPHAFRTKSQISYSVAKRENKPRRDVASGIDAVVDALDLLSKERGLEFMTTHAQLSGISREPTSKIPGYLRELADDGHIEFKVEKGKGTLISVKAGWK